MTDREHVTGAQTLIGPPELSTTDAMMEFHPGQQDLPRENKDLIHQSHSVGKVLKSTNLAFSLLSF